jgi:hypothetical protein
LTGSPNCSGNGTLRPAATTQNACLQTFQTPLSGFQDGAIVTTKRLLDALVLLILAAGLPGCVSDPERQAPARDPQFVIAGRALLELFDQVTKAPANILVVKHRGTSALFRRLPSDSDAYYIDFALRPKGAKTANWFHARVDESFAGTVLLSAGAFDVLFSGEERRSETLQIGGETVTCDVVGPIQLIVAPAEYSGSCDVHRMPGSKSAP